MRRHVAAVRQTFLLQNQSMCLPLCLATSLDAVTTKP